MRAVTMATIAVSMVSMAGAMAPMGAVAQQTAQDAAKPANIRILPDQAVLRCQARAMHDLQAEGVEDAKPVQRFATERMENFMYNVKGLYVGQVEGEDRQIDVSCDVSSAGVEVFTMEIEQMDDETKKQLDSQS